jgi:hypothetical protein
VLEIMAAQGGSEDPAIIIMVWQKSSALVRLALYIGLTGLALGVQPSSPDLWRTFHKRILMAGRPRSMSEPIVDLPLRPKRGRIESAIAASERKIKATQADLAHDTAWLRLFELSGDSAEIPAYIDLNRILRRGEVTNLCMAALKAEGPLDTRELTHQIMAAKGLNPDDRVLAQDNSLRIVQTLRMKALRGAVLDGSERSKGACVRRLR